MSLSRRAFLSSALLVGGGSVLAACGETATAKPPAWQDRKSVV